MVQAGRSFRSMAAVGVLALSMATGCNAATLPIPGPKIDSPLAARSGRETAVFAGGCFWGTQTVFEHVKGVIETAAGYDGGSRDTATYAQVTTETTKHAESVQIVFDPARITYGELLQVFFAIHDPTEVNRQGPDVGTSYRSAIFTTGADQARIAKAYISQLTQAKTFPRQIATEVTPSPGFYKAEDYHQDYALNNPDNPYIMVCDRPKLATLRDQFPQLYVPYKGH